MNTIPAGAVAPASGSSPTLSGTLLAGLGGSGGNGAGSLGLAFASLRGEAVGLRSVLAPLSSAITDFGQALRSAFTGSTVSSASPAPAHPLTAQPVQSSGPSPAPGLLAPAGAAGLALSGLARQADATSDALARVQTSGASTSTGSGTGPIRTGVVSEAFSGLKTFASGLAGVFSGLAGATSVSKGVGALGSRVGAAVQPLASRVKKAFGTVGRAVTRGMPKELPKQIQRVGAGVGRIARGATQTGKALGKGAGAVASGAVGLASGATLGVAGLAMEGLQALAGAFTSTVGKVRGFAEALNPSSGMILDMAFRDLSATIGVALEPVMQAAAGAVRAFGAVLYPVMEQLRPVVRQLTQAFGQVVSVAVNAFGSALQALAPVFQFVADVASALVPVFQAVSSIGAGLVAVAGEAFRGILGAFGVDVKDVLAGFRSAMQSLAKYTLLGAAAMARWIDSLIGTKLNKAFTEGATKALTGEGVEKKSTAGRAAAKNAQVGDLAGFGRSVTQAALLAGMGGARESAEDTWRKEIVTQLKALSEGQRNDWDTFRTEVLKKFDAFLDKLTRPVSEGAAAGYSAARPAWELAAGGLPAILARAASGNLFGG